VVVSTLRTIFLGKTEKITVDWKVRAIRGATTASANTVEAIAEVVTELLDEVESHNRLDPEDIVSVFFSVTRDIDVIFPAAIARQRRGWDCVAMLDLQQMYVEDSLQRCIRLLMHVATPDPTIPVRHCYLRHAQNLRPDWSMPVVNFKSI
jgi:chorismate mutase